MDQQLAAARQSGNPRDFLLGISTEDHGESLIVDAIVQRGHHAVGYGDRANE